MLIDTFMRLSGTNATPPVPQALTTISEVTYSDNYVDLSTRRDVGEGVDLHALFTPHTASFTSGDAAASLIMEIVAFPTALPATGARPTFTFNSTTGVDDATETITTTAHGLPEGTCIRVSGTPPTGLSAATDYFVIAPTANTFKVAASIGGAAIDLTDAVGTCTVTVHYPRNSFTFTSTHASDILVATAHGLTDGTAVVLATVGGDLPNGLSVGTTYYVVNATANNFQVSATPGGSAATFSDDGTGTFVCVFMPRVLASSGAVSLARLVAASSSAVPPLGAQVELCLHPQPSGTKGTDVRGGVIYARYIPTSPGTVRDPNYLGKTVALTAGQMIADIVIGSAGTTAKNRHYPTAYSFS